MRQQDAFELAQLHDEVDAYATALEDDGTPDDYMAIARYYESKQRWGKAGEFFAVCGQYHKALKLFLQCGESEMDKAIEVVGKARVDMLTHTLIDFLMGETDGVPKDPNYIFRLYMALGNYPQAAKTALIISRQEQELGNYKVSGVALLMLGDTARICLLCRVNELRWLVLFGLPHRLTTQASLSPSHTRPPACLPALCFGCLGRA